MTYRLLQEFRKLFEGKKYLHRKSNLGDWVAMHLYEDLCELARAQKFCDHVFGHDVILASNNLRRGIKSRRGDGTLGVRVPTSVVVEDPGFRVGRGEIASLQIGVEVKILAKAMLKQIDRVISDLANQATNWKKGGENPVSVAIIGINRAPIYTSYEGKRSFTTGGRNGRHPAQEAEEAERRIRDLALPTFDEGLILRFRATNKKPYPFEWVSEAETEKDYGAVLVRVSSKYNARF